MILSLMHLPFLIHSPFRYKIKILGPDTELMKDYLEGVHYVRIVIYRAVNIVIGLIDQTVYNISV